MVGLSARLSLDDDYRGFCELVAVHISTAVANAQAYEAERKRAEMLAALDRAKTEFFSNVSHEFRTPITLMLNPLQELLSGASGALTEQQRENLDMAYRNSLRLLKLVNTLLDFSRIQADRIRASFEPLDLAQLTADLASSFRSIIERAGMRFVVECPPLSQPTYVDREMWEKIVLNLLSNAFKFTFEGEIAVILRENGNQAELTVRDSGVGIPAEALPRIFERFHRARTARSRTYEGSGIGLSLVQELVGLHGGEARVESEPGVGTSFTVSIPFGYAHLPQDQIARPSAASPGTVGAVPYVEEALSWLSKLPADPLGYGRDKDQLPINSVYPNIQPVSQSQASEIQVQERVLVVDDNADMRDYLSRLLRGQFLVDVAVDGQAALTSIEQQPPDLILTDVMMPTVDGFELLRRLRTEASGRLLPIIMLSARGGSEARIEAMQAGADDYMVKPFSASELLARIEAQLKIARLRQEVIASESEARIRFQHILESITDAFYTVDRRWRFLYVNQQAAYLWGKDREELIGKNIWQEFPEMISRETYRHLQRAMLTKTLVRFESFGSLTNAWYSVAAFPGAEELSVYFQDISDRKRNENIQRFLVAAGELLNSTLDYESIFQNIARLAVPDLADWCSIDSIENDLSIRLVSAAHVDPAKVALAHEIRRRYPPTADQPGYHEAIFDRKATIFPVIDSAALEAVAHDVEELHIVQQLALKSSMVVPIIGRSRVLGVITFLTSESGRHYSPSDLPLVEELARRAALAIENASLYQAEANARREAETANVLKLQFLAMISHELRTPLTSIKGFATTLLSKDVTWDAESQESFIAIINEEADKLTELIDQLLDLSRLAAGRLRVNLERQQLRDIISIAMAQLESLTGQHRLLISLPPDLPPVLADSHRIAQVICNLVSNATKYAPKQTKIQLSAVKLSTEIQISVSDEGPGIPKENRAAVFEAFRQLDTVPLQQQKGAGLGLAICKGLVEAHGGRIWVVDQNAPGTTVAFTLPIVP